MKHSIILTTSKSLWKGLRPKILLIAVVFFSLLFLVTYVNYRYISTEVNLQTGHENFGNYQLYMYDITLDNATIISDDSYVAQSTLLYAKQTDDRKAKMVFSHRDLFELANYELLEGEFPTSEKEVLCEQKYLAQLGLSFDKDNKPHLKVNGIEYSVSGIYRANEFVQIVGMYIPTFIFSYDHSIGAIDSGEPNYSVMCTTIGDPSYVREVFIDKYRLSDDAVTLNNHVLAYAAVDGDGQTTDVFVQACDYLIYIILGFMIVLFVSLFVLLCKKNRTTIAIYTALGISKRQLCWSALLILVCLFGALSFLLVFFSLFISIFIINDLHIPTLLVLNVSVVLPHVTLCVIISMISFARLFPKDIALALSNRSDVSERKTKKNHLESSLQTSRLPFLKMAQLNVSMHMGKQMIAVIGLVIASVFTSTFLYIANYIFIDSGEYQYDYRIDYTYSTFVEERKGTEENYLKYLDMTKQENTFRVYPFYYQIHPTKIKKTNLSEQFVDFLRKSSSYSHKELDHIDNTLYEDNCFILGADEEQLRNVYNIDGLSSYNLADDECIVVKNVRTPDGVGFEHGLQEKDTFYLSYANYAEDVGAIGNDIEISVKEVVSNINLPLSSCYYMPIIIVNHNVFNMLSKYEYDYPQQIYLNSECNYNQLIDYFKGCSGMTLTDLTRVKKQINELKVTLGTTFILCGILLLAVLTLNLFINFIDKYQRNLKQLATLKALGVERKRLLLFLIYEIIAVIGFSIPLGTVLSIVICYFVHLYIRQKLFYFTFEIMPFVYWIPVLCVLLVSLFLISTFWKKMGRIDIVESLQKE